MPSAYWCWEPWLAAKVSNGFEKGLLRTSAKNQKRCMQTGQTGSEAEGLLGHGWS